MHIDASPQVHANQADDVFLRVGDKSKLQTFEERLQLNYDKGERYFNHVNDLLLLIRKLSGMEILIFWPRIRLMTVL